MIHITHQETTDEDSSTSADETSNHPKLATIEIQPPTSMILLPRPNTRSSPTPTVPTTTR